MKLLTHPLLGRKYLVEVALRGVSFWEGVSSVANELLIWFIHRLYMYRTYAQMHIFIHTVMRKHTLNTSLKIIFWNPVKPTPGVEDQLEGPL